MKSHSIVIEGTTVYVAGAYDGYNEATKEAVLRAVIDNQLRWGDRLESMRIVRVTHQDRPRPVVYWVARTV